MSELLDALASRAEDARRNRESYSKASRSRRITQEDSAKDVPRLLVAVRAMQSLADWHETKAHKARTYPGDAKTGRVIMEKAAAVHDDAALRIRRAITEALEGDR